MPYPVRNGNSVKFLLDGEEFFSAIRTNFIAVENTPRGTPHTYVRLAWWVIAADMKLGDLAVRNLEENRIQRRIGSVLRAGHDVDLILWYPNMKERGMMEEQKEEHDKLAKQLVDVDIALLAQTKWKSGRCRVYRERYEGWTGSSQHQKIGIFSINGQRTVIVGGVNMAERYFDTVGHTRNTNWHDTAIEIKGPVTTDIEDEWMRRWQKVIDIADAKVPSEILYNHLSSRDIKSEWKLKGAADITRNTTVQTNQTMGGVAGCHYNIPSQVALTRSSKTSKVTEIRDRVVELIKQAQRRIYFENNQFTDPDIVRAIYQRKAQVPNLELVILTNPSDGGVGYLTRRAWLHMALRHPSCSQVQYVSKTDDSGLRVIDRGTGAAPAWTVEDNYQPGSQGAQWLQTDCISIAKATGGAMFASANKKKMFHEIDDLAVNFHFYTPVEHTGWIQPDAVAAPTVWWPQFRTFCLHSKLAIIDDYFLCGSSNWTYRSMQWDGEIQVISQNRALADFVLGRLLAHYDVHHAVTLANIGDTARASADQLIAAGRPNTPFMGGLFLMPLEYRWAEIGLKLFWGIESPHHSWFDRLMNPKKRFEGMKSDLPNWQWW